MIGKMLNAIVAASVITAAGGAQDQPRPPRQGGTTERPQQREQPREPQGERARGESLGTPGTTPTPGIGVGNGDQPGRRLGENARTDDRERPNPEALVFRFLAEHPEFLERLIARADKDGDGRLSPDERAAMREQLRARAQERRDDRQDFRDDRREDVQDFLQDRRDDRQDFREERRDDVQDIREERRDDRQDFRDGRADDRADDRAENRQDRVEGRAENRQDRVDGRAPNRQDGPERVETRGRPAPTPPRPMPPRVGPGGRGRQ